MDKRPDNQPSHNKKNPATTILTWILVANGAQQFVADALSWFGLG